MPLSNRNVVSSAIGSMLAISARPGDRFFIALPLFHVGGAFCTSLAGLGAGATLVIPTAGGFRNPDVVSNFWRIVEAQRITHGALVLTGLAAAAAVLLDGADIFAAAFFRHRRFRLSGNRAALSGRLVRRLRAPNLRYDRIRWRHRTRRRMIANRTWLRWHPGGAC